MAATHITGVVQSTRPQVVHTTRTSLVQYSADGDTLATTNIIESPHSGVRMRTRRVTNWKDGSMVMRWAASGFLATEKDFRRMMGYRDLWILAAALDRRVDREGAAA